MNRHRFDPASFMFGALFLVVGLTFLTGGRTDLGHPVRLWPVTIVVVGLSLAIWAVSRAIRPEPAPLVGTAVTDASVAVAGAIPEDEGAAEATTVTAELPPADDADQDEGPRP